MPPQAIQSGQDVTALMRPITSGEDVTSLMTPTFRQTDTSPNEIDPNTVGTFVSHLGAQINPFTLVQTVGQAILHPIDTTKAIGKAQGALYDKAKASYDKGDYLTAARHFVDYLIPLVGPGLDKSADEFQAKHWAAGGGDAIGLGLAMFGPKALANVAAARYPLATHPAATAPARPNPTVAFAEQREIPLDAATVSDNFAVKGVQAITDRSLGGAIVATPARANQAAAMARVGGELADEAHPVPMVPETAGTNLRTALTTKIARHAQEANTAYDAVRQLESGRTTVNVAPVKVALKPLVDQMERQLPITQQQANPGLKALKNILDGPDAAPLSQIDADLSVIKALARERGGVAKIAVSRLESAVMQAATRGGPPVVQALKEGRTATIAKYAASDVLDTLNTEPVRAIRALTVPKDAAIQQLRAVVKEVPDQAPIIARGFLEELLASPQKVAEWRKLGAQTKAILFPKAGQAEALDHFFTLTDRMSKTNVNPSQSGYVALLGAQGAMFWTNPVVATTLQLSAATVSALLRSPVAIRALTRGLSLPNTAPAAVKAAAFSTLLKVAQTEGIPLALPAAASAPATGALVPATTGAGSR